MVGCSVFTCKRRSETSNMSKDGVSYHLFPKDPILRKAWVKFCNRGHNWVPTRTSSICSDHFDPISFQSKKIAKNSRRRLTEIAKPTLFGCDCKCASSLSSAKIVKGESGEALTTSSVGGVLVTVIKTEVNPDSDPLQSRRCASPSGLSDNDSSDLEDALDIQGVLLLKKKLREKEEKLKEKDQKLKEREESLRDKDEKLKLKDERLERLEKANQRLNEKIVNLKQLIVKMKKKLLMLKRKVKDQSDDKDLDES